MFEFFIALFGGLFWGGKYAKEKSETRQAQQTHELNKTKDSCRESEWLSKVTNKKLEAELEAFVYDNSNYDAIWSEVSVAYRDMPWETENFICLCPEAVEVAYGKGTFTKKQRENIASNNRLKALRILLANRGKLRTEDASYYGTPTSSWSGVPLLTEQQWSEQETKFMLWTTNQLAKHGVHEELYIRQNGTDAFLASKFPLYRGYYVWEPVIPYFYTKHK